MVKVVMEEMYDKFFFETGDPGKGGKGEDGEG